MPDETETHPDIDALWERYQQLRAPALQILNNNPATLSILAFPRGEFAHLMNLESQAHRNYALRATCYALTAWVFELQAPRSSARVIAQTQLAAPAQAAERMQELHALWVRVSQTTIELIENNISNEDIEEAEFKLLFQQLSRQDEQKLCHALLRGFETQLPQYEKVDWIYQYSIPYGA